MKTPAVILALAFALLIGYWYGQPHQSTADTRAQKAAIHAHNVTACGAYWLPSDYAESTTENDINRHDNPIYNCRMAEEERYFDQCDGYQDPRQDHRSHVLPSSRTPRVSRATPMTRQTGPSGTGSPVPRKRPPVPSRSVRPTGFSPGHN
jgi:hypothetical protein